MVPRLDAFSGDWSLIFAAALAMRARRCFSYAQPMQNFALRTQRIQNLMHVVAARDRDDKASLRT